MSASPSETISLYGRMASQLGAKVSPPDARKAGIAISNEIVALSHADRETVFRQLRSSEDGLDVSEAAARLKTAGPISSRKKNAPAFFANSRAAPRIPSMACS